MSNFQEQKPSDQPGSDPMSVYFETAMKLKESGRLDEAIQILEKAVLVNASDADLHYNLANTYMSKACWQDATRHYRQALAINPAFANALNNLGVALKNSGNARAAIDALQQAMALQPDNAEFHNNLGIAFQIEGELSRAAIHFRKAITLNSNFAEAFYNLGFLFQHNNDPEVAVKCYANAIRLRPGFFDAHNNLAVTLHTLGHLPESRKHYEQAIRLHPGSDDARWNRSMLMLSTGDFEDGWPEFEYRLTQSDWATNYPFKLLKPRWKGELLQGRRLLVHDEQGFGDTIQFIRYLPLVKAYGGHTLLETRQPLVSLLHNFPGIDEIVVRTATERPEVDYDVYSPLLSLPMLFRTRAGNVPFPEGYLKAHPGKADYWRKKLRKGNYKVGIAWAGNPAHKNDLNRSCSLEQFRMLLDLEKIEFISLQKDITAHDREIVNDTCRIEDFGEAIEDFSDTAALIDNLDLVLSVDTAVAHIAGAMGKPTWVLLPYVADWRWMYNRSDSLWYHSVRLFRQNKPGEWQSVFREIKKELVKVR